MRCLKYLILLLLSFSTAHAVDITTCQTIDTAGTYVLQNDVSSDGTCFSITEPNVVLDLNGHTVTYDNLAQIAVPNSSFETTLTGSWDVTNAAGATRELGMFTGTTVSKFDGDYALAFALPITGTQYVTSQEITLAANTAYNIHAMFRNSGNYDIENPHAGDYRNSYTLSVGLVGETQTGFINGVSWRGFQLTNFTYTTGASPENHTIIIAVSPDWQSNISYSAANIVESGGKTYTSLQAANSNHNPADTSAWQIVYSAATATWSDSITYAINALVNYSGKTYRSLVAANLNNLPTDATKWVEVWDEETTAYASGTTYAVDDYVSQGLRTYKSLISSNIGNEPADTSWWRKTSDDILSDNATGHVYVDSVAVLTQNSYGVGAGVGFVPAHYSTIKNGVISQGVGAGYESHAIYLEELAGTGFDINNVVFNVHGPNSKPLYSKFWNGSTFNNNTINHTTTKIKSRDNYNGASVHSIYASTVPGSIHDNVFNYGPQTAIYTHVCTSCQHEIYNNEVSLQTIVTNDFAIISEGNWVHHNTVDCTSGSNSCRGIRIGGTGTKVHNNTVSVQQLPRNQEYNGCEMAGAYGVQAEYGTVGAETYENEITVIAGECEATALRLNSSYDGSASIDIHDNVFTATKTGTAPAYAMKLANMYGSGYVIDSNEFIANDKWLYLEYDESSVKLMDTVFTSNKFSTSGTLTDPFRPFLVGTGVHGDITFVDNIYGSANDLFLFTSEAFRTSTGTIDTGSSITKSVTGSPTIVTNVPAGRYRWTQDVTLVGNEDVDIVYCKDVDSDCTPATAYSAPFKVVQNIALEHYCFQGTDSDENTTAVECHTVRKQRFDN